MLHKIGPAAPASMINFGSSFNVCPLFVWRSRSWYSLHNLPLAKESSEIAAEENFFPQNEITEIFPALFVVFAFIPLYRSRVTGAEDEKLKTTSGTVKILPIKLFILFDLCFSFLLVSAESPARMGLDKQKQNKEKGFPHPSDLFLITTSFEQS